MNPQPPGGNYPGNQPQYPNQRPFGAAPGGPTGPAPYPQGYGQPFGGAQGGPQYPQQYPPGAQPYGRQGPPYPYPTQKPYSVKAIVSMVMAGVSVFMCPVGVITGIVGSVLGYMGMQESKEPGGTHRGHGLAVAGLILGIASFVISVGVCGLIAWAVVEGQEQARQNEQMFASWAAERDMQVIAERLNLYAIENKRSLGPGGPVVKDGWAVSYDENTPRVKSKLALTDLVRDYDLERPVSEYTMELIGVTGARVRNESAGVTLVVTNAADNDWRVDTDTTP